MKKRISLVAFVLFASGCDLRDATIPKNADQVVEQLIRIEIVVQEPARVRRMRDVRLSPKLRRMPFVRP